MRVLLRHLAPRHPPCTLCSLSHDVEKLKFPRLSHFARRFRPALLLPYAEELSVPVSAFPRRQNLNCSFRPIQLLTCRPNSTRDWRFEIGDYRVALRLLLIHSPLSPFSIRGWRLLTNPPAVNLQSPISNLSSLLRPGRRFISNLQSLISNLSSFMETTGFEPVTSCLQSRRSPS